MKRNQRVSIVVGSITGLATMAYLLVLAITSNAPLLAILLMVATGAVMIPAGIWLSLRLKRTIRREE
jgi:hypothetical protein